jgi:uncharacterized protein
MKVHTENVFFPAQEIQIEGMLGHLPGRENAPAVLICHPHPQNGGSMDNNVVHGMFREFVGRGYVAMAFNFRGTGRSGGSYEGGVGEITDALCGLKYLQGRSTGRDRNLGLVGYSFGAWVALQTALRAGEMVCCVGAVAPPVEIFPFDFLARYEGPLFLVWGDRDPFCPSAKADSMLSGVSARRERKTLAGTDHFFLGREHEAAAFLCDRFMPFLGSPGKTIPDDSR